MQRTKLQDHRLPDSMRAHSSASTSGVLRQCPSKIFIAVTPGQRRARSAHLTQLLEHVQLALNLPPRLVRGLSRQRNIQYRKSAGMCTKNRSVKCSSGQRLITMVQLCRRCLDRPVQLRVPQACVDSLAHIWNQKPRLRCFGAQLRRFVRSGPQHGELQIVQTRIWPMRVVPSKHIGFQQRAAAFLRTSCKGVLASDAGT